MTEEEVFLLCEHSTHGLGDHPEDEKAVWFVRGGHCPKCSNPATPKAMCDWVIRQWKTVGVKCSVCKYVGTIEDFQVRLDEI